MTKPNAPLFYINQQNEWKTTVIFHAWYRHFPKHIMHYQENCLNLCELLLLQKKSQAFLHIEKNSEKLHTVQVQKKKF